LAIVSAIKYFHQFFAGRHFTVYTDHYSLASVLGWKDPPLRIARWIQYLSEYHFTAKYKSGATLLNADALSRLPSHYVKRNILPDQLTGELIMGGELKPLSSTYRVQDMLDEHFPNALELHARTPMGKISVSAGYVLPLALEQRRKSNRIAIREMDPAILPTQEQLVNTTADTLREAEPEHDGPYALEDLHKYLGRIFEDEEEGKEYVIMDLFFDSKLQQVVGYRAPVKAADVDINDLEEIYTFDYFLRMLADKPEKYTAGTGEQSLVDEDYRRAVGQSLTTWYEQSKISPHEVFLLVDE